MSSQVSLTDFNHISGRWVKVSTPASHVALVELSRNPVNALHQLFWTELGDVFDKLGEEPAVRVVVLASALDKLFSAGIDFSSLPAPSTDLDPARRALQLQRVLTSFQASISAIERCPYPVIGATHGLAIGLAIDILAACDVRYAASNAVFSIKEVDVGLAADIGTLARLPKVTGNQSLVNELALTARNFSATDADKMGFVSRVTAKLIAEKSPVAVLGTKRLLLHARDHSVRENLEYTTVWNGVMVQTQDIPVSVKAFQKKHKPEYERLGSKL
ncbi:ClpP/crotonase [Earliella scabrosa]|nr:ClpP/crotonase [Earliella scabrosa]